MKAEITKAQVVIYRSSPFLLAVAECGDSCMNIRVKLNYDTTDWSHLYSDLTDKIAEGFDIPKSEVDIKRHHLEKKIALGVMEAMLRGIQ